MKASPIQIAAVLLLLSFAAGCGIVRKYDPEKLRSNVPQNAYRDPIKGDSSMAQLPVKQFFQDEILRNLIDEAFKNNQDLKIARLKVEAAQAIFKQRKQNVLPSLDANPSVTFNKQSKAALNLPPNININLKTVTVQLPLGASWEADIWGKIASAKRAALADMLAQDAVHRAFMTELASMIAKQYFQLQALDAQRAVTLEALELRKKDLETLKALKSAALVDGTSVEQASANLLSAEISLLELEKSIKEKENAISVLVGRTPGPIERNLLEDEVFIAELQTGFPIELLANRPDVQAAEFNFISSFENVNVARASFYPSLTLTARGGLSALTTNNLFLNSLFTNAVAGILQPIYNRGLNKMNLSRAEIQQYQALHSFNALLLTAGEEVSNAMFAYETIERKEALRQSQVEHLQRSLDFTKELLLTNSGTNYLDVLIAEQSLLNAKLMRIDDQLQKRSAIVELYRALGGGWR